MKADNYGHTKDRGREIKMRKQIEELNLEDDFLFAKVMSDPELCRKVLEKILKISIKKVVFTSSQRTIDMLLESKGIRLDIYVSDEKGTVYNCEMQRTNRADLPKRSRYYQGNIDLDLIAAGERYENLKNSFVIFICTFDPFKEARHIYTFHNTCEESPRLCLGDGTTKIFLNTKGVIEDVDEELKEFLEYVENSSDEFALQSQSSFIKELHEKVTEVKRSEELEAEYMTLLQRDRENREMGREEGREEGTQRMAILIEELMGENRYEDIKRSATDSEYRKKLFQELGI